jgi:hypothetical protein
MGYMMSKHASLSHFSPYFLLFGRHPIPPSFVATQMDQVVDLDFPCIWAKVITKRVVVLRRVKPMPMESLSIAQRQDALRYANTRGDSYKPKVTQFHVSDFVSFQRPNDILNIFSSRTILRIKVIMLSNVLELQGIDERIVRNHSKNCAPCHLLNLDPTIITSTWIPSFDYPC